MHWNFISLDIIRSAYREWMVCVAYWQVCSEFSMWHHCWFQLAQLLAELNSIPDLFPVKTPASTPSVSRHYQLELTGVFARLKINMFPNETPSPILFWFSLILVTLFVWICYWSVFINQGLCEGMEFCKIIHEEIRRPRWDATLSFLLQKCFWDARQMSVYMGIQKSSCFVFRSC